jgi:hypothetical protein
MVGITVIGITTCPKIGYTFVPSIIIGGNKKINIEGARYPEH